MVDITDDDVLKLAKLSKLKVDPAKISQFKNDLQSILGYIEQLSEVDVTGLKPTNQVTGLKNVMREDEVYEVVSPADLLKVVPALEANQIKVHRVLE